MLRAILAGIFGSLCWATYADEPPAVAGKPQYERMLTGSAIKQAELLRERISRAEEADRYDEAIRSSEELLSLRTTLQGADHWEAASEKWALDAVRTVAKLPVAHRAGYRDACQSALEAPQLESRGAREKALSLKQDHRGWCERVLGELHPATATSYLNLANSLRVNGKHSEAQEHYLKAIEAYRTRLGEHPHLANAYNGLAQSLHQQEKHLESQSLLERGLEIRRQVLGERHFETATNYNNLAMNLSAQGDSAGAQVLYERALDAFRDVLGEKNALVATCYENCGVNLTTQGRQAEGQRLIEQALAMRRELFGERHLAIATSLHSLARNLAEQGRLEDARALAEKSLEMRRQLLGDMHPAVGGGHQALANLLHQLEKYDQAQPHYQAAVALRREQFGANHPDVARGLGSLAANLQAQGNFEDARRHFGAAFYSCRELLGENHPDTVACQINLAINRVAREDHAGARSLLSRAAAGYETARLRVSNRGLDRAVFGARRSPYRLLSALDAGAGSSVTAYAAAEGDLARGLCDEVALRRGTGLVEALAVAQSADLKDIQENLRADAALLLWIDVSGAGVEEHWGCVVRQLGEPKWERLSGSGSHGKWIKRDNELPAEFRSAIASAAFSAAELEGIQKRLRAQRFAPLVKHLDGVRSLYVVPVDQLAGVPVEVMFPGQIVSYVPSGNFLVQLRRGKAPLGNRLLALGDPIFGVPKRDLGSVPVPLQETQIATVEERKYANRGGPWKELPGTRAEVSQLKALFGQDATSLVDSAASEFALDALRATGELAKFRYFHFGTHGEANNSQAFESALILAQDRRSQDSLPRAGQPFINGQLTAQEVLEFWRLDAELVTLSACETALGRTGGGDGLLGFAQAFLAVGARSVCVSLWKVDDSATALLMGRFYQNILGKRPGLDKPVGKAAALAEAKEWLRKLSFDEASILNASIAKGAERGTRGKGEDLKLAVPATDSKQPVARDFKPFAHPRFWSAFVLIGDPN